MAFSKTGICLAHGIALGVVRRPMQAVTTVGGGQTPIVYARWRLFDICSKVRQRDPGGRDDVCDAIDDSRNYIGCCSTPACNAKDPFPKFGSAKVAAIIRAILHPVNTQVAK